MVSDNQNTGFHVESSLDLLIVLLYAPGQSGFVAEPIDGITRLQKLMFLLQQGKGPKHLVAAAEEYFYSAYKMGPHTKELYKDLEVIKSLGFLKTTKLNYVFTDDSLEDNESEDTTVESTRFELMGKGVEAGQELFSNLQAKDREGLVEFKSFFNSLSLRQLLIFVYRQFPSYTSESEIKGQLGIE